MEEQMIDMNLAVGVTSRYVTIIVDDVHVYLSVLISMVTSMVPVCPWCHFAQARPTM